MREPLASKRGEIDQAALKPSNISDSSQDFWDKEKDDGIRD
jgi:hypothetical protein